MELHVECKVNLNYYAVFEYSSKRRLYSQVQYLRWVVVKKPGIFVMGIVVHVCYVPRCSSSMMVVISVSYA